MPQKHPFQYIIKSFDTHYPLFVQALEEYCQKEKISSAKIFDLELSLEELVVNSFRHGNKDGPIKVDLEIQREKITVIIEDFAPHFNILKDTPPPPEGNLMERSIGGLGVHLVKKLADSVDYTPLKQGNRITLCFKALYD